MADDGKFTIKGRVSTWPGLRNYSLRLNLRQIGIETKPDDPAITRWVDNAYRKFSKRQVTRAELGEMLSLTKAERVEFEIWQILPCDETTAERKVWLRQRDAERKANRRRMQGAKSREEWLMQNNLSKTKPWKAEGISRKTWYKRQAKANRGVTGSSVAYSCISTLDIPVTPIADTNVAKRPAEKECVTSVASPPAHEKRAEDRRLAAPHRPAPDTPVALAWYTPVITEIWNSASGLPYPCEYLEAAE